MKSISFAAIFINIIFPFRCWVDSLSLYGFGGNRVFGQVSANNGIRTDRRRQMAPAKDLAIVAHKIGNNQITILIIITPHETRTRTFNSNSPTKLQQVLKIFHNPPRVRDYLQEIEGEIILSSVARSYLNITLVDVNVTFFHNNCISFWWKITESNWSEVVALTWKISNSMFCWVCLRSIWKEKNCILRKRKVFHSNK